MMTSIVLAAVCVLSTASTRAGELAPSSSLRSAEQVWYSVANNASTTSKEAYDLYQLALQSKGVEVRLKYFQQLLKDYAADILRNEDGVEATYGKIARKQIELNSCVLEQQGLRPEKQVYIILLNLKAWEDGSKENRLLSAMSCGFAIELEAVPEYLARIGADRFLKVLSEEASFIDWEKTIDPSRQPQKVSAFGYAAPIYDKRGKIPFSLSLSQYEGGWLWTGVRVRDKALLEKWKITSDDIVFP